jgi:hypothetical protein
MKNIFKQLITWWKRRRYDKQARARGFKNWEEYAQFLEYGMGHSHIKVEEPNECS